MNNPPLVKADSASNTSLYKEQAARNASVDEKSAVYKNEEWTKLINTNSADASLC